MHTCIHTCMQSQQSRMPSAGAVHGGVPAGRTLALGCRESVYDHLPACLALGSLLQRSLSHRAPVLLGDCRRAGRHRALAGWLQARDVCHGGRFATLSVRCSLPPLSMHMVNNMQRITVVTQNSSFIFLYVRSNEHFICWINLCKKHFIC